MLERLGLLGQLGEHVLQEGGADEVGRRRIGEAAGIGLGPLEQGRDGARRLRHGRGVVEEHELGHAPGRLEAIGRHREVNERGRLAHRIDVAEVRQVLHERAEQQVLRLHRGEVLAVDPDQVDRAALGAPGRLLGDHARHRLGGVGQLDVDEVDAVALVHLLADPFDVGVDLRIAAPGMPVHGLAARFGQRVVAGRRVGGLAEREHKDGSQKSQPHLPDPSAATPTVLRRGIIGRAAGCHPRVRPLTRLRCRVNAGSACGVRLFRSPALPLSRAGDTACLSCECAGAAGAQITPCARNSSIAAGP